MSWFNSIEFYVIAGALAAGAVAYAALPQRRGTGRQYLLAGELSGSGDILPQSPTPAIDIEVDDRGRVHLTRTGLPQITDAGAVSLAVNVVGFDVIIQERLTYGRGWPTVGTARFTLDFLGPERYKIRYNTDQDTGLLTAFTLNVAPGLRLHRELK